MKKSLNRLFLIFYGGKHMKLLIEANREEIKTLEDQINKNLDNLLEKGNIIIYVKDLFKETVLENNFRDVDYGLIIKK